MSRRLPSRLALAEPALLAAIAVLVAFDASRYPAALPGAGPGPAFFPRLLAALLIAGAGALAFRTLRRPAAPTGRPGRWTPLAGAVLAVAAFLLFLPLISRIAALPLLVAGLMGLSGERSPVVLVLVPLGFTAVVELVFVRTLGVPLP